MCKPIQQDSIVRASIDEELRHIVRYGLRSRALDRYSCVNFDCQVIVENYSKTFMENLLTIMMDRGSFLQQYE